MRSATELSAPATLSGMSDNRPAQGRTAGEDARHRRYLLAGQADRGPAACARPVSGGDPDRKPARHHAAGARNPRRRRSGGLRGHAGDPQAVRSLRPLGAVDPLSRPQCRGGAAADPGEDRGRRCGGAGLRCRNAADLRPRLQAGACRGSGRPCGHGGARGFGGADRAHGVGACRPTGSFSRGFCRRRPTRGRRASASLRASRQRSCCSRAARASRRRLPTSRPASARARPPSAASSPSCTKRSGAEHSWRWRGDYAAGAETRGEFVDHDRRAACGRSSRRAAEIDALLRAALARTSVKDAVAEVAAAPVSRAARSTAARSS